MTRDDRDRLGPAELLLEAADRAIENHGTSGVVDAAPVAQARKKVPEPELGARTRAECLRIGLRRSRTGLCFLRRETISRMQRRTVLGMILNLFTPVECANYFIAAG